MLHLTGARDKSCRVEGGSAVSMVTIPSVARCLIRGVLSTMIVVPPASQVGGITPLPILSRRGVAVRAWEAPRRVMVTNHG